MLTLFRSPLIVCLVTTGSLVAADPIMPPDSDTVLTIKLKAALAASPELAGLNLLVSVADRVAVVGGSLPNLDLQDRVEQVARQVSGLKSLKVECWLAPVEDPLARRVADRLASPKPVTPEKTSRPSLALSIPALDPVRPPLAEPTRVPGRVTVHRAQAPPVGFLLDPQPASDRRPSDRAMSYPTIPPPSVPTASLSDLLVEVQSRETRFQSMRIQNRGNTVTIESTPSSAEAAWDLAAQVRKVPGVHRVVVNTAATR